MLGYFQEPYEPQEEAELLILPKIPKVKQADVTSEQLVVYFGEGRTISVPLEWFPRLLYATQEERQALEIWGDDWLHWEALDEDISVTGLFKMTGPSVERDASIHRWLESRKQNGQQSADTLATGSQTATAADLKESECD